MAVTCASFNGIGFSSMATATTSSNEVELNSPELLRQVNALRKMDNVTNWFYIAREYLFLGLVIGLTIAFYHYRAAWELSWLWNAPVTFVAIVLIGAGQHRLTNIGHEASHYMLFHNRVLNELASDWLAMFPVWSTTHHYRLQHLAHHQFPNDPELSHAQAAVSVGMHPQAVSVGAKPDSLYPRAGQIRLDRQW